MDKSDTLVKRKEGLGNVDAKKRRELEKDSAIVQGKEVGCDPDDDSIIL